MRLVLWRLSSPSACSALWFARRLGAGDASHVTDPISPADASRKEEGLSAAHRSMYANGERVRPTGRQRSFWTLPVARKSARLWSVRRLLLRLTREQGTRSVLPGSGEGVRAEGHRGVYGSRGCVRGWLGVSRDVRGRRSCSIWDARTVTVGLRRVGSSAGCGDGIQRDAVRAKTLMDRAAAR